MNSLLNNKKGFLRSCGYDGCDFAEKMDNFFLQNRNRHYRISHITVNSLLNNKKGFLRSCGYDGCDFAEKMDNFFLQNRNRH